MVARQKKKGAGEGNRIFYLTLSGEGHIKFVNNSEETLDKVFDVSSSGFGGPFDPHPKIYRNVQPGKSVVINKFDWMYDPYEDCEWGVTLTSPKLGTLTLKSKQKKGGEPEATLLSKHDYIRLLG